MKRGQITAFVIIGIVILGAFGFTFYISRYVSNAEFEKKIDKIVSDIRQNTPINFYVTECLDNSLREGLYLIGRQGGFILPHQEGALLDSGWHWESYMRNSYLEYGNNSITYLIQQLDSGKIKFNDAPYYPCEERNIESDNPCGFRHPANGPNSGYYYFGLNPLFYGDFPFYTLLRSERMSGGTGTSVQEQLEYYVSYHIKNCVNFSSVGERFGHNITEGDVITNISIGRDDVVANVNFPLIITVEGREPITKMFEFYGQEQVRLSLIYNILKKIIYNPQNFGSSDQTDLSFDILNEDLNTNGIYITKQEGVIDLEPQTLYYNDVFILNDNLSILGTDDHYIFQFARQNRMPVLDYICDDPDNPPSCPTETPVGSGVRYDFTVLSGYNISIRPIAHDPDEDYFYFNYSGWMETWNETWNSTRFYELENTPENCTWFPKNCVDIVEGQPSSWTLSNPSYAYGGKVFYTTSINDLGAHNLTVKVNDYENGAPPGYSDWQTVSILVVDHPEADPGNSNNDYDDIERHKASIEDIYWLDAGSSTGMFCTPWEYKWTDDSETTGLFGGTNILFRGQQQRVAVPYPPLCFDSSCVNISDMTGTFNNYSGDSGYGPKEHNIVLSIIPLGCPNINQYPDDAYWAVNVSLCLPHTSDSAPYPYNDVEENPFYHTSYTEVVGDPFQGDHACCSGEESDWGNYKSESTICYNFRSFGPKPVVGKEYYPANLTVGDTGGVQGVLFDVDASVNQSDINLMGINQQDSENDIFIRGLRQFCSGSRGNTCSGDVEENWVLVETCLDLEPGQTERCRGPWNPDWGLVEGEMMKRTEYFCHDYEEGESFEKTYLRLEGADGVCNENWKVSDDVNQGYNEEGNYLCQAACGGNGYCNQPVNCKLIDDYDKRIPLYDIPKDEEPNSYLPAVNTIWGYTGNTVRPSPNPDISHTTNVPPPSEETSETWCDGKCFSIGGTMTSPTSIDGGNDFCTSRDYYAERKSDSTGVNDTIGFDTVDLDNASHWCTSCSDPSFVDQKTEWIESGELNVGEYPDEGVEDCCGDDPGEYSNICNNRYEGYDPAGCIDDENVCCNQRTDCINTSQECNQAGNCYGFGSSGKKAYCDAEEEGVWKDPDTNRDYCIAAGCGFNWTRKKSGGWGCCGDDPGEDWLGVPARIACDDGKKVECGYGNMCNTIMIGATEYICTWTAWVENTGVIGCGQGGICTDDIIEPCCGDADEEDIVYDDSVDDYYCGCYGNQGLGCEDVEKDAGGDYNQNGICATNNNGATFDCFTTPPIVYSSYYVPNCVDEAGNDCTNTVNQGPYSREGACTGDILDSIMCCDGLAIDSDGDGEPDVCEEPCSYYANPSINNYCEEVSDNQWSTDKECDNTGDDCITCNGRTDNSGNCEEVCDAYDGCDELEPDSEICGDHGVSEGKCRNTCTYSSTGSGRCSVECGADNFCDGRLPDRVPTSDNGWCCNYDPVRETCVSNDGCDWCTQEFVWEDDEVHHCGCNIDIRFGNDDGNYCDWEKDGKLEITGRCDESGECVPFR
ncbi:hypothetical protein HQ529_05660 [Candidatus Woesearchaeota archaeon]|nr:hypothetical protein [Candidatus Woesearchaeota archaeon]